jgi:HEAT repeat protein
MRSAIVAITLVTLVGLSRLGAQVPRKEDTPKNLALLKTASNAKDRAFAAEQLGLRGQVRASDVKDAIDPLLEAVKADPSANVRKEAVTALGRIAPDPETTVPVLTDALKDKAPEVRMAAAPALAAFGNDARSALPALREMAASSDKKLSKAAKMAIKSIACKKKNQ